jgi:hypothetical protein
MLEDSDPIATIKVTFDDLPDDLKYNIYLFFNLLCTLIITVLVLVYLFLLDSIGRRIYNYHQSTNHYSRLHENVFNEGH